jgi:peptidoglycan/LPS O-acetylase OafA/YrhL
MRQGLPEERPISRERLATRHRHDIQGLRAIAVLLVALNHAGVGFLKGGYVGVDVFFVLSGYLITGVLVSSAHDAEHRTFFSNFYARRARRILPAATLTLLVTDFAATHMLSLARAHQVLVDSVSSAFFVANFHFANIGTNYFAIGQPPSPLQHYWSLSVEEQFYLVWPVLVALALLGIVLRGRRFGYRERSRSEGTGVALEAIAVLITVASFAYAIYDTHHNATAAYFSSPARAWELGLGAVLSLHVHRLARLPSTLLAVSGWLGLGCIAVASTLYSSTTLFPGLPALLPTVGAAAFIAAGLPIDQSKLAPSRILALQPFRFVGDRSYTFYLWHWPVLILVAENAERSLSVATNLLLLLGAFALSAVTYQFFENPLRRTPKLRGSVAVALWPVAIAAVIFVTSIHWEDYADAVNVARVAPIEVFKETPETSSIASGESVHTGWRPSSPSAVVQAVAAVHKAARLPAPLTPSALSLPSSEYRVPGGCVADLVATSSKVCSLGDTSSSKSLVVFGDSHAMMWLPAIIAFAQRERYVVRPVMKLGCSAHEWAGPDRTANCSAWYRWALGQVHTLRPALLVIGTHYNVMPAEGEVEYTGPNSIISVSALANAVRSSAHKIAVIGDPPGEEQEPGDCLVSSHATMKRCSYVEVPGQPKVTDGMEEATKSFGVFLDTTPWFCYHGVCPMVVGHTVLYFSRSHITQQYAEELAPLFTHGLSKLLAHGAAKPKAGSSS